MVCYASPEKCQPLPLQKTSGADRGMRLSKLVTRRPR